MAKRKGLGPLLSPEEIQRIKDRVKSGEIQHVVAADYLVNQGRISELMSGKRQTIRDGRI